MLYALYDIPGRIHRKCNVSHGGYIMATKKEQASIIPMGANETISVRFSLAQRKLLAESQPQFEPLLRLNEKNGITIVFSTFDVKIIQEFAENAPKQATNGTIRNSWYLIGDKLKVALAKQSASKVIFQFKITLMQSKPPIWRRIQIQNCTLDKLHEHIQTAMGWTNSHLHDFEIDDQRYGDPELLDEGFEDFDCVNSTQTMISDIIPNNRKRFSFNYQYDFGDSWDHEILFEGCPPLDPTVKYPICLEGERACPPEDVGGIWGYAEFLEVLANPKHAEHESILEWCGGKFSPDKFDPVKATKEMTQGLPDWRRM
jgi:hypothetical protein